VKLISDTFCIGAVKEEARIVADQGVIVEDTK